MKNITVLSFTGKQNIGDEAYRLSFPLLFPNCKFTFTDYINKKDKSDELILGGGDILSKKLIDHILNFNKPTHIVSASANDHIDPEQLKKFKTIVVRDKHSIDLLKSKGIEAHYAPDIAFALTPNKDNGKKLIDKAFQFPKRDRYEKVVVVVLNGYLIDNNAINYDIRKFLYFNNLSFQLGHLMDYTNASFLFVPFGQEFPGDDRVPNIWTLQKAKFWEKNAFIFSEPNVQNILDIISAADAVISTRLHSTIFSMVGKTPFLDITHNHKNKWLLETVKLKHMSIPYTSFNEEEARNKLNDLIINRQNYLKELSAIVDNQKELLENLQDVCDLQ